MFVAISSCAGDNRTDFTDTRIINGTLAKLGQFPWQASIFHIRNSRAALCGGSLINPEWVLTAAHCVFGVHSFSIRLGTTVGYGPTDQKTMQIFEPAAILLHPEFQLDTFYNDVALMRLNKPAILNTFVQPIELAELKEDPLVGEDLIASGWGKIIETGKVVTDLHFAHLRVIPTEICQQYFDVVLRPETVCCIGENKENTCSGDSGGPLVKYNSGGTPKQVGIVSFSTNKGELETLCSLGYPTGYVRVARYRGWILKIIGV